MRDICEEGESNSGNGCLKGRTPEQCILIEIDRMEEAREIDWERKFSKYKDEHFRRLG